MSEITVAPAKPTADEVRALRLRTLRTIAELAERHALPMPEELHTQACDFRGGWTGLSLDLTFGRDDMRAVKRWATVLGLASPVAKSYPMKDDGGDLMQHEYTSRTWTY